MPTKSVRRFFLLLFSGIILPLIAILWIILRNPSHPSDHLTLQNGQTTVVKLKCPADNHQWDGYFRLGEGMPPIIGGPSQILIRLKNLEAYPLDTMSVVGEGELHFAPGEIKEIYRGTLDELLRGGTLNLFSHNRSDANVELQIDSSLSQQDPLRIDILWGYTHYSF